MRRRPGRVHEFWAETAGCGVDGGRCWKRPGEASEGQRLDTAGSGSAVVREAWLKRKARVGEAVGAGAMTRLREDSLPFVTINDESLQSAMIDQFYYDSLLILACFIWPTLLLTTKQWKQHTERNLVDDKRLCTVREWCTKGCTGEVIEFQEH